MKVWYIDDMSLLNTINEGIESAIISLALSVDNTFLIIGKKTWPLKHSQTNLSHKLPLEVFRCMRFVIRLDQQCMP